MAFNSNISTIKNVIVENGDKLTDRVVFYEKIKRKTVGHTYGELKEDVLALGTSLLKRGLKDKHIAVIGENSYSWIVSYLAIINGVGVAVPLDKEFDEELIGNLLDKSDAEAVILSKSLIPKRNEIMKNSTSLKTCISMQENNDGVEDIWALIEEGKKLIESGDRSYIDRKVNIDALNIIMFTSGTTGANKGVMISQRNIITNMQVGTELFKTYKTTMAVLPFHHVYANMCCILIPINIGMTVFINDSLKYLMNNMRRFRPQLVTMVPLFLETMSKSLDIELKRRKVDRIYRNAVKANTVLEKVHINIRRLMFKQILDTFGGIKTIVCGGAVLRPELVDKFGELGIRVMNGFGITECTPLVSVNTDKKASAKSVGKIVDSCKVSILNSNEDGIGEIMVSGDNVMMGYYKDEEGNRKSFYKQWFKTGDLGYVDENNNLFITGRKKNLIVLSNGKNVHPEELEGYIMKNMNYVQECIVYVDKSRSGSDIISAYVYINKDYIDDMGKENVRKMIDGDLLKLNKKLPTYKQVQSIYIRDHEFEKNTAKKIVRQKFLEEVYGIG